MRKMCVVAVVLALVSPAPARAQLAVVDPVAVAQLIQIIFQVEETIRRMEAQAVTIERMRTGLRSMGRYRLPGVPIGGYNTGRYPYAADILAGMNSGGDPDGNAYQRTVQKLQLPAAVFAGLSPEARLILSASYATVELLDSTAILGQWTAGQTRGYSGQLQTRIDRLQDDVTNGVSEPVANLDKLALAATLRSRQQMASTQLQSALVDQMIGAAKGRRDAEVESLNMQFRSLSDGGAAARSMTEGSAAVLRGWTLP